MRDTDPSDIAADMHRLANDIERLADSSDMLANESVNTPASNTLREQQEEIQQELRQLISNLIQLHAESGTIETQGREYSLGKRGSVPINGKANLPAPTVGKPGRGEEGPPSWANSDGN